MMQKAAMVRESIAATIFSGPGGRWQLGLVYDAVLRNLEVLGEAAKKVPEDVRNRYPWVEWRAIAGLRDVLAHAYFALDDATLWDIVARKVPALAEALRQILEEEDA
jgi:uncharacterized protein with HEPN domain